MVHKSVVRFDRFISSPTDRWGMAMAREAWPDVVKYRPTTDSPRKGGQAELISDQTIFERTHVLGALELHGLEKASSALMSGQWSGTCLIRGQFGLIRGSFKRTVVWSEANSSAH